MRKPYLETYISWIKDEFNKTAENFSKHIDSFRFDLAS